MGESGDLFRDVQEAVETWTPREEYGDAEEFREALEEFLDVKLNARPGGLADPFGASRKDLWVATGNTPEDADITVGYTEDDPVVAVQVTRNLDPDGSRALRTRIDELLDRYDYVVACACGVTDEDAWTDLQETYSDTDAEALLGRAVALVRKNREDYTENR